jgi:AAA domain
VVVDTVSRALAGGDENSPSDMGNFVSNCDRLREDTRATVLGVHHVPKGGADPRGHSCLKNGSEVRMLAKKVGHKLFQLDLEHLKDGEAGGELLFELESAVVGTNVDGEEVTGGLVIQTNLRPAGGSGGSAKKLTETQMRILQEMNKTAGSTKRWEFTRDEFKELCLKSGAVDAELPENQQRNRFSQLRNQLANRSLITVESDKLRLKGADLRDFT